MWLAEYYRRGERLARLGHKNDSSRLGLLEFLLCCHAMKAIKQCYEDACKDQNWGFLQMFSTDLPDNKSILK